MDAPTLQQGLLGYSRKSVHAYLAEREVTIVRASRDAREAESRASELAAELERTRRESAERAGLIDAAEASTARLRAELDEARAGLAEADLRSVELEGRNMTLESELAEAEDRIHAFEREQTAGADDDMPSTTDGVIEVLESIERAIARLIEGARRNAEVELRETERARDDLRGEVDRLLSWRDRVIPLTAEVRRAIDQTHSQTAALAGRLSELAETSAPQPAGEPIEGTGPVILLEEAANNGEAGGEAWSSERAAEPRAG